MGSIVAASPSTCGDRLAGGITERLARGVMGLTRLFLVLLLTVRSDAAAAAANDKAGGNKSKQ